MLIRVVSFSLSALLLAAVLSSVTMKTAHAYIDLGSASFLFQGLIVALFASLFSIKIFWRRITSRLSRVLARLNRSGPAMNDERDSGT